MVDKFVDIIKIRLTPQVINEVQFVRKLKLKQSGFLLGTHFGRYYIVTRIIWIPLNENAFLEKLKHSYDGCGSNLIGAIFSNIEVKKNTWLLEDLIIEISDSRIQCFFYSAIENKILPVKFEE